MYYWIRLATYEDIEDLVNIEEKAFPPNPEEDPWDSGNFKYYLEHYNAFVLVAETKDEIIGKSVGMIYNGCVNRGLQVLDLAVKRDYKRMGIGTELLKNIEELGKHLGCSYSAVNVLSKSKPAIKAYKKFGYKTLSGFSSQDRLVRMRKEFLEG